MLNDLITAVLVAFAAVIASGLEGEPFDGAGDGRYLFTGSGL